MRKVDTLNENSSIVKQYKIGDTKIIIHDTAYKDRTPQEIQETLNRITEIGWEIVLAARARGEDI